MFKLRLTLFYLGQVQMKKYRGFLIWGICVLLIMGGFLFFVNVGWPGVPSNCIYDSPDTCYCEAFDEGEIHSHAPGVRQPVNTWSNLIAIVNSFIVASVVSYDRKNLGGGRIRNLMRSNTLVPDLYIFVVLFLGLGSIWFHGSLTEWGGRIDGVSMYTFTIFLTFYTIRRNWNVGWFFWIGYLSVLTLFSIFHIYSDLSSAIKIAITVLLYLIAEVITWIRQGKILQGKSPATLLWIFAVLSILTASFFWWASQTGNFMCNPNSLFQPHGLIWHTLAGFTALFLYFYWRSAHD